MTFCEEIKRFPRIVDSVRVHKDDLHLKGLQLHIRFAVKHLFLWVNKTHTEVNCMYESQVYSYKLSLQVQIESMGTVTFVPHLKLPPQRNGNA